jgi:hypothetical protein
LINGSSITGYQNKETEMNRKSMKIVTVIISTVVLVPTAAWTSTTGTAGRGELREPPPEAFTACTNKNEGDTVEVITPDGKTLKAVCRQLNGKLAALPQMGGPGSGPGNGSPPRDRGND